MASMQYYRSCSETYENQHHENSSLTHKVSDMVGKAFHGNSHKHNHNNQSLCHGQTTLQPHPHHPHHNHQLGQYGAGYLTPTLSNGGYDHHGNHGYNNACSTECGNGTYEIRKVKNRSHSHRHKPNKHRDGNRSCSDDSSGSDSD